MFPQFLAPMEPGPQNYLEKIAELDLQIRKLQKRRGAVILSPEKLKYPPSLELSQQSFQKYDEVSP